MKFFDNGAGFTVSFSRKDSADFARRWPCSTVRGSGSFAFDRRGNLVDVSGAAARGDGSDWVAFSQDCQRFGEQSRRGRLPQAPERGDEYPLPLTSVPKVAPDGASGAPRCTEVFVLSAPMKREAVLRALRARGCGYVATHGGSVELACWQPYGARFARESWRGELVGCGAAVFVRDVRDERAQHPRELPGVWRAIGALSTLPRCPMCDSTEHVALVRTIDEQSGSRLFVCDRCPTSFGATPRGAAWSLDSVEDEPR